MKVLLLEEYCPRGEIQKLEQELWNLKMTGSDLVAYMARFNDLAALCPAMVNPEPKKVERYIWGLSPQIQGHVLASNPITFNNAKRQAQRLIDHEGQTGYCCSYCRSIKGGTGPQKALEQEKGANPTGEPQETTSGSGSLCYWPYHHCTHKFLQWEISEVQPMQLPPPWSLQ